MPSPKWTDDELKDAVQLYLKMLKYEKDGTTYVKAEINRELQGKTKRSRTSVDKRFQNISFILNQQRLPYIPGYKPLSNVGPTNEEKIWKLIQQLQNL